MAAWTASSLFPQSLIRNTVNQAMTPAQKLAASGGVTRQALTQAIVPAATSGGATVRRDNVVPGATNPASTNVTPASTNNSGNTPNFLQSGQNQSSNPQQDLLSLLQDLIGGQKQDPELVKAQTVLAQQQAMQAARGNEEARNRESNLAAQDYLRSQLKDAAKYQTGSVGNILTQRYNDRLKVLQDEGRLNWLNMPSSSYSVPRRSGWTGPAMPGTWGL